MSFIKQQRLSGVFDVYTKGEDSRQVNQLALKQLPEKYQNRYLQTRVYAQTLLKALRSQEVRDISVRFRNSLGSSSKIPKEERIHSHGVHRLIETVVIAKRIEAPPEMAEKFHRYSSMQISPPQTIAYHFYHSMAYSH
ncbi:MAG: hypothetical protein ACXWC9_04505 [Pseudobdellovibrionaceae bacterium]